jgi:DNA-directed RNA polymerase specialized sigma24 family protein
VIDWDRIKVWDYIVDTVASEYHKKFDMIELNDIRQSLYEWFAEHPNKLNEWEAIGKKDAKNLIYRSLRNQALDYCQRWKAKSGGYELSDLFYYEADMVEALLPPVLRGEFGVTHKLNLGRTGRSPAPAEGGNLMAMMIEIDYAFWKMSKNERRLLFLRYAEGMDFGDIGKELDLGSEDAVRMRHKRVLRKLINKIGGFKPYKDNDLPDKDKETPDGVEETDNTEEE